jgi:hypothetical protein
MKCKCKRCGFSWESVVDEPRACPRCKSYEWRTPKTRGYRATVADRERRDPDFKEALREERRKEG